MPPLFWKFATCLAALLASTSTAMAGNQDRAHIAASPNNDYTIVFFGPDSDFTRIYATCMQPDGCVDVFADGFESGDVSSWSGSMP